MLPLQIITKLHAVMFLSVLIVICPFILKVARKDIIDKLSNHAYHTFDEEMKVQLDDDGDHVERGEASNMVI